MLFEVTLVLLGLKINVLFLKINFKGSKDIFVIFIN